MKLFILLLLTLLPLNVYAFDLNEALILAYKNNPALKVARSSLESIDENISQAYSGWLPTISATYNRQRVSEQVSSSSRTYDSPDLRAVTLRQPIFNGGSTLASVKLARNQIMGERERLKQTEQQVLSQAVIAYSDVVRTREVLRLSKNNEKVLDEQREATIDRFKLGETTRTDVAQSESRLARAEADRIKAHGQLIAAMSEYRRVFDEEPPENMDIPKNLPDIPDKFEEAKKKAVDNNPTIKRARFNEAAAKNSISISKSKILPTVDITGDIRKDSGMSLRRGGSVDSNSISLSVVVPLFQSGSEYSRIRQSKKNAESARFQLSDTYNSVVDNVTKTWQDIITSKASVRANQTSMKAAELALEGIRQEQKIGSRTILDVLDAEQELFVAQVNLITARRNEVVSAYNLKASLGELTVSNLGLDVKQYDPEKNYNNVKYRMFGF